MTTARLIENRITRQLLRRREIESRGHKVDRMIVGLALIAAVATLGVIVPVLLLPIFIVCGIITLGL